MKGTVKKRHSDETIQLSPTERLAIVKEYSDIGKWCMTSSPIVIALVANAMKDALVASHHARPVVLSLLSSAVAIYVLAFMLFVRLFTTTPWLLMAKEVEEQREEFVSATRIFFCAVCSVLIMILFLSAAYAIALW